MEASTSYSKAVMEAKPWSMIQDTCFGFGPAITLGIAFFIAVTFGVQVFKIGNHVVGLAIGIPVGILVVGLVKKFGGINCMMSNEETPGWQEWYHRAGQGFKGHDEGVPMVDFLLLDSLTEKKFNYKAASMADSCAKCFNCCD